VVLTGNKREQAMFHRHSGYPGGLRSTAYGELLDTRPALVVEKAIRGMLPKNKLGRDQARKLKVYAGSTHPHEAQKPTRYEITQVAQ
jgi:large subunit ribosomal protein L13